MNGRDGDCGDISDTKCGTDWNANRRNFAGDTVYERASFSFGRVAGNVFIIEVVAVFGGFFFAGFFIFLMTGGVYFSVGASNAIGDSFLKILGVCVGVAGGFEIVKNIASMAVTFVIFGSGFIKEASDTSAFGAIVGVAKISIRGKFVGEGIGVDNFVIIFQNSFTSRESLVGFENAVGIDVADINTFTAKTLFKIR